MLHEKQSKQSGEEKQVSHTPGPWFIVPTRDGEGFDVQTHPDRSICCYIVGTAWNGGELDEQVGANARLMAASPDLLTASKELLHIIETNTRMMDWIGAANQLRDAIRKAEGEARHG